MESTILLVDDHPVFRKGLRLLLEENQGLCVVGEAGDGEEAIQCARELTPDVIVMDITMPNLNGIKATQRILSEFPETRIVILSIHSGKRFVSDVFSAGAVGYILKESVPEELVNGIKAVTQGEMFLSKSITGVVVSQYLEAMSHAKAPDQETATAPVAIKSTKFHPPPVPKDHLHRDYLMKQLEEGRNRPMALVAAPAGYGKSTLVSCWLEKTDAASAWLSVDEDDNDLRSFLTYFLQAFENKMPDAVGKSMGMITAPVLPSIATFVNCLVNEMERIEQDFVLVLDDIQLIRERSIWDFLGAFLQHPPNGMHLVLIGRREPLLAMSHLRAGAQVNEIRMQDLRFNSEETQIYLQHLLGTDIEKSVAATWSETTEGWVTGLRLAGLSMKQKGIYSLQTEIPRNIQYVTEYLFDEVLSYQSKPVRLYLLGTSILDRFCAPLCDAVCGPGLEPDQAFDSWKFIAVLKKENMFIINLDNENRWYRYHNLFQHLLKNQLNRSVNSSEISKMHLRASRWFADNGMLTEAVRHALTAGDTEGAAAIVEKNRHAILNEDRWFALKDLVAMLPETVIQRRPELLMSRVWVLYHQFDIPKIPSAIDTIEALLSDGEQDASLGGEIDFFRGYVYYFMNEGGLSLGHLKNAMEVTTGTDDEFRGQVVILYCLANQMQDGKQKAIEILNNLLYGQKYVRGVRRTRFLATLVYIHLISGDMIRAAVANQELFDFSKKNRFLYAEAWGAYLSGLINFYTNNLDEAINGFSQAFEKRHVLQIRAMIDCMAGLTLSFQATGKTDLSEDMMKNLMQGVETLTDPTYSIIAQSCRLRLSIMRGESRLEDGFLEESAFAEANLVWWAENPSITFCRALIFDGSASCLQEAETKLQELLKRNQAQHNILCSVKILSLLTVIHAKQKRFDVALKMLGQAIDLAEPGGLIRPFVESGPLMSAALDQLLKKNVSVAFIKKILAAFDDSKRDAASESPTAEDAQETMAPQTSGNRSDVAPGGNQDLIEPLTNRELDILEMLSQRLQSKEIADKLFISPETVKSHLKNIYQKLGATGRRNAVEKAKALAIL